MEHAVIVHLRLSDSSFGSAEEREAMYALEGQLDKAIQEASAGEFDGDEFGEGECVLFMYGPDADRLFGAIAPVLKAACPPAEGYAIKRYGEARDPNASEIRITWR